MKQEKPPTYFEAVLQLRNPNEEAMNCVMNALRKRKGVFIAKKVDLKEGMDLYLSSQRFTRSIGRLLKKSFKGELVESKRLHGTDKMTSKLRYRGTVLFRFE